MKKTIMAMLVTALALAFVSCAGERGEESQLKTGIYTLNGTEMGPYVWFDTENSSWHTGRGIAFSYALGGTYSQTKDKITAKGGDGNDIEIQFQIVSEKEIKVLSVRENVFLPDNRWIGEGEHYMLVSEDSAGMTPEALFETVFSAEEALERARETEAVVLERRGCTAGKEVWDQFYQKVTEGKPASVLCAYYYELDKEYVSEELYEEEKNQYPKLFFYMVEYDGEKFTVMTRESTKQAPDYQDSFSCLLHLTGNAPAGALYSTYDRYVLADDPSLTWEEIMAGMLSSRAGDVRRSCTVYYDYMGWTGD